MKGNVTYFESMGKANTDETLRIAKESALEAGINTVIVSSSGGFTAKKALKLFDGTDVSIIVVGFQKGFPPELVLELKKEGHEVLFPGQHEFNHPTEAWEVLRRFCEGMKVCVQEVLMASEVGMVDVGEEVVALGGTGTVEYEQGGGCDTAIVMEAVKGENFFNLDLPAYDKKMQGRKIKEILCKPR